MTRTRASLLAAGVIAALATSATSASAADTHPLVAEPRGRAGHVLADRLASGQAPKVRLVAPESTGATERTAASATSTTATTGDCTPDALDVAIFADHTYVTARWPGASSIELTRTVNSSTRTIATLTGASGDRSDHDLSPYTFRLYGLVARDAGGAVVGGCQNARPHTYATGGWNLPDGVLAGPDGLVQGPATLVDETAPQQVRATGSWVTPAYSADGRLVAASRFDAGLGRVVLDVRRSTDLALAFRVDLGTSQFAADPAFSPDGQTLAYTRYDASGDPLGLGFVDVFGSHTRRALTADVPVAEPAWRPDGTSVVVTAYDAADGLSLLCTTCTTAVPISNTAGGYTPEVADDGTIYFGRTGTTTTAIRKRTADGSAVTVKSASADTAFFERPRVAADGTLWYGAYLVDAVRGDSYDVRSVTPSGGTSQVMHLSARVTSPDDVVRWDLRQPQPKGTSQFTGVGTNDLLVRDGSGSLWSYGVDDHGDITGRTRLGTGWGGFPLVLAAGDLTSDDRADVLARDASGVLWLYKGTGPQRLGDRLRIGGGWGAYTLLPVGDWNGDGRADVLARDGAGVLWLYPGTGTGTLAARSQVGSGWGGFTALVPAGEVDVDAAVDLLARDSAGRLWLYRGNGTGGFLPRVQLGTGWGSFTLFAATDRTSSGSTFWVRTSAGQLVRWTLTDTPSVVGRTPLGYGWNGLLVSA